MSKEVAIHDNLLVPMQLAGKPVAELANFVSKPIGGIHWFSAICEIHDDELIFSFKKPFLRKKHPDYTIFLKHINNINIPKFPMNQINISYADDKFWMNIRFRSLHDTEEFFSNIQLCLKKHVLK